MVPAVVRAYRLAVRLLPPTFRREFAGPMARLFERRTLARARAEGARAVVRWWTRAGLDLGLTLAREWAEAITIRQGAERGAKGTTMRGTFDALWIELRHAVRGLARNPGFTVAVVFVLGAGIGANAGMFELADRLLQRPPAFLATPDHVHRLYIDRQIQSGRVQDPSFSWPAYAALEARDPAGWNAHGVFGGTLFVAWGDDVARPRPVKAVTGGYFDLFDARPAIGRWLGPDDARLDAPLAAVLSHAFWSTELGADPAVLGQDLEIGQRRYTIVGVAPSGFHGEDLRQSVAWVPMQHAGADIAGPEYATRAGTTWIEILVRRSAGASLEATTAQVEQAFLDWAGEAWSAAFLERSEPRALLAPVLREQGPHRSDAARISAWLFGMSVVVLLLAAVNVSTLMLGRTVRRARETAVRAALGVSRMRLLAGPLVESALLATVAALLAVPAAHTLVRVTARVLLPADTVLPSLSARSMALAGGAALLAGIVTSAAPILALLRRPSAAGLREGSRAGRSRGRLRAQRGLVATQAALSAVLLVAAGLFGRSLARVAALDLGYDADRVALVTTAARSPLAEASSIREGEASRERLMATLQGAAASLPGVEATALTATVPFLRNSFERIYLEDGSPAFDGVSQAAHVVAGDYFETMGTPIVRGRPLRASDDGSSPPVVVLSEHMAQALWPGQEALGRCVRPGVDTMPCFEVVGVARGIRRGDLQDDAMRQFYVHAEHYYYGTPGVVAVRTRADAATLAEPLRRRLQDAVGDAAFVRVDLLADRIDMQTGSWRLGAAVFTGFGALALVLAALGLFSVVAYDVSRRRREFGVRTALGARREDLLALVVRTGLWPPALGVAAGLALAWLFGRPVEALLFGVPARDPFSFGAVAAVLLVSAAGAALIPAHRASSTEPRVALEAE